MIKCKICGYEVNLNLSNHIRRVHNLSSNEYLEKFPNSEIIDKDYKARMDKINGDKFKEINKSRSKEWYKKWNSNPELIEKRHKSKLEKYGNGNNTEKIRETCLEKYGTTTARASEGVQNKIKQTNMKRYGVENVSQVEEIKQKRIETFKRNYGLDSPLKDEMIRRKIKQTNLERYGGTGFASKQIKEKYNETCLKRYGVKNANSSLKIINKIRSTKLKRYGTLNLINYKKSKETCLEKYGVPYNCLTPQCIEAAKSTVISNINKNFSQLLNENNIKNEFEFRIGNRNFDIGIKEIKTVIEIDPVVTHNQTFAPPFGNKVKPLDYHLERTNLANKYEYHCIHVFDWDNWDKIINIINPNKEIIYARKCEIREVDKKECDEFLNNYHLQNSCKGQIIRLGLFHNNELCGLMTFGKPRYNKNYQWELLRLCFNKNIIGGSEKLFKYFISNYNPKNIISYCDKSKFTGKVYKKLDFELLSESKPQCHWYNLKTKRHITDNLLRQRGFSQLHNDNNYELANKGDSNEQLMLKNNYVKFYDCGQMTFVWKKDKKEED